MIHDNSLHQSTTVWSIGICTRSREALTRSVSGGSIESALWTVWRGRVDFRLFFYWAGKLLAFIRTDEDLIAELSPVVEGLGYLIVEAKHARMRGTTHVTLVIYRSDGVTVDGCADVSRTVLPRLSILFDTQDVALEVGSPGIDRKIKHNREYGIFIGRGVQVLLRDTADWFGGVIRSADDSIVEIEGAAGPRAVAYDQIQKAKLDEAQEVR